MRKSEIVAKRLAEFSAVVQKDLETYVIAHKLLLPGQQAVFSVRIEKVPTVVQDIDQGRETLLDMPANEFFTYARFSSIGDESSIVNRVVSAIEGEVASQERGKEERYTVRHFIADYGYRLRRREPYFLPNAGAKSKQLTIQVLEAAGVWER